jgi:NAD-binding of NADP-dependent 3-hydroxyisobutyrate dehydrogenase
MKVLNNFLGASASTTAVEALAIGKECGLDPRVMLDVVNSSTGRSFNTEVGGGGGRPGLRRRPLRGAQVVVGDRPRGGLERHRSVHI